MRGLVFFQSRLFEGRVIPKFICPSAANGKTELRETEYFGLVAITNYLGVCGTSYQAKDGLFCIDTSRRAGEILDGMSNTLAFGEWPTDDIGGFGWWYCGWGGNGTLLGTRELNYYFGRQINCTQVIDTCPEGPYEYEKGAGEPCDTRHFWSYHSGGCYFAFADGSVKFIS